MQTTLNRLGFELRPRTGPSLSAEEGRRALLLNSRDITLVLDVGASFGMYGRQLRRLGFGSRIVSFEPLSDAFAALEDAASGDPLWECRQLALGSSDTVAEINIAGNSTSSSLLEMKDRHLQSAPEARYVSTQQVRVARLSSIWSDVVGEEDRVYLKLDVQGFELEALRGVGAHLQSVSCVQAELSFVPLYDGAPGFLELIDYLGSEGFRLAGLEGAHEDRRTGEMLQSDGIFVRDS